MWTRSLLVRVCALTIAVAASFNGLILPSDALAETYFGGMLGGTFPNRFSDVETGNGTKFSDLELKNAFAAGVMLGHYFSKAEWLGIETELFATSPKFKAQTASGTGPGCPCTLTTSGSNLRTITWAFNAVVRYPGEKFQPYAGAGLGLFFAEDRTQGSKADNAVPGLNALAGARYFITNEIALFGEYKYTRASFNFGNDVALSGGGTTSLKGDYSANMLMVGVSAHFK